ncbi:hypothetical protein RESH_02416 [Rhodopirellula europaea SH398]|uniref:Uncharacterized protein n=1 Tax=Rhodopirellula europaea SH398 TaxID=1263868 RepID=M5S663_9BACT|nr:hypothetical protein RESH_02416 [Rhodopirellula europaea SH398]
MRLAPFDTTDSEGLPNTTTVYREQQQQIVRTRSNPRRSTTQSCIIILTYTSLSSQGIRPEHGLTYYDSG